MTDKNILMTTPMHPIVAQSLEPAFKLHRLWLQEDKQAFLQEFGPAMHGLVTSTLYGRVDHKLLDHLPALEIISSFGVGYDNVDVGLAAQKGVVVTNTPGVLDDEVADFTLGLLLATLRQIPQAECHLREGRWLNGAFPLSPTLRGRKIGIVGLGNIGKAVARRLEGFGVSIAYHGRREQKDVPYPFYPDLIAMAKACDVLIVIVPGGNATRHMINRQVLQALGPTGVLINVARGSVVDEQALIAALQAGEILTAGLDVFEHEPQVPQALLDMPQLVLLPHIGSASHHTRQAMGQLVADNLISWFDQGHAITPVPECCT
jgi:lactate dehydrogenase-like 2-hydroxyacid dehydrogenase